MGRHARRTAAFASAAAIFVSLAAAAEIFLLPWSGLVGPSPVAAASVSSSASKRGSASAAVVAGTDSAAFVVSGRRLPSLGGGTRRRKSASRLRTEAPASFPLIADVDGASLSSFRGEDECIISSEEEDEVTGGRLSSSGGNNRRAFLLSAAAASALPAAAADAAGFPNLFGRRDSGLLLLNSREGASSVQAVVGTGGDAALSAERCLLRLLPVRNPVFLALQAEIERVSVLKSKDNAAAAVGDGEYGISDAAWKAASNAANNALRLLDTKRDRLQPVFNQDLDSTEMQIRRAQRGEDLIEDLRAEIVHLIDSTGGLVKEVQPEKKGRSGTTVAEDEDALALPRNATEAFEAQRLALLALAGVGELLVNVFPYDVPERGKFSYLPRLLGRARVTFTMKRDAKPGAAQQILGNVTIIADGFAAPITAGNFIDLCVRGFYTGLPIRAVGKRLGSAAALAESSSAYATLGSKVGLKFDQEEGGGSTGGTSSSAGTIITTTLPIWGSFNEGFYDPLTAKPRRIPLEIVELDRSLPGGAKLLYAGGFADSSGTGSFGGGTGSSGALSLVKRTPVITFGIPGVVAMNHPDRNVNGGSSEFFILPEKDMNPEKTKLLDRQYAPFGYVVEGYDLLKTLRPGDVISATEVGEWGRANLVKVRSTTFGEIIGGGVGTEEEEEEEAGGKGN